MKIEAPTNEIMTRMKGAPKALECGGFPPLSQRDEAANNPSAQPASEPFWTVPWKNPWHEVIVDASASESGGKPPHSKALKRSFGGHPSFPRSPITSLLLLVLAAVALTANAQTAPPSPSLGSNLIPNGNFTAAVPFQGWRIDFPYEGWYVKNKTYLSLTSEHAKNGGKCVQIDLPPGIAGNEGGKIESAFIKAEPGATYRVEIDCLTWDFSAKTFVEAWVTDPKPVATPDKFRIPAGNGHPALLMVYRAAVPDPKGNSKQWETVSREFTLPKSRPVGPQEMAPEFLSIKAYTYAATMKGGKCFFGNFRLIQKTRGGEGVK